MASYLDTNGLNHLWLKLKNIFYQKPSGGIPKSDLESSVQTSLGKADSAYQKPSSGIPKSELESSVQMSLGKADSSYQKPSGGIPKTDLASSVQTSLEKADSSIQEHQDISGKLDKSGGTMTGAISMGATSAIRNKITMLADPTADYDAVNKKYVDDTANSLNTDDINLSASSEHYAETDTVTEVFDGITTDLIHKVDEKYVDDAIAGCLPLAGGTMEGDIAMYGNKLLLSSDSSATSVALYQNASGVWLAKPNAEGGYADRYVELKGIFTPTDDYSAANKKYVDESIAEIRLEVGDGSIATADALPKTGGQMSGAINMDGNRISNLPSPSANGDAANKEYVDNAVANCGYGVVINGQWREGTGVDLAIPSTANNAHEYLRGLYTAGNLPELHIEGNDWIAIYRLSKVSMYYLVFSNVERWDDDTLSISTIRVSDSGCIYSAMEF